MRTDPHDLKYHIQLLQSEVSETKHHLRVMTDRFNALFTDYSRLVKSLTSQPIQENTNAVHTTDP